jgi:hypothetical protein
VPRVAKGKASEAEIWALGRLAARAPIYGPANAVVAPDVVEPWLERLCAADWDRPASVALAVASIGRRTGDRARDVREETAGAVAARLEREPSGERFARWVREVVPIDVGQQALVLSEALPAGLRLASVPATPAS